MTTVIKIVGKPYASASQSLEQHADWLYNHPGGRIIGVVEFAHTARVEPAPDVDKARAVELTISGLELGTSEQEEPLRKAMRALYLQRTAIGTLDPDGEVEMSQRVLAETVGTLGLTESIRLRTALAHWADYARRVFNTREISFTELMHELDSICSGLQRALEPHGTDDLRELDR